MHDFLLTATDRDGKRSTHHVRASGSQEAYQVLERGEYSDIVLHTDDAAAAAVPLTALDDELITPEDMIVLRGVSSGGFFLFLLKKLYIQWWFLEILAAGTLLVKWWNAVDLGLFGVAAIAVLVSPLPIAIWATLIGSARNYDLLLESYSWCRWEDVLARAPALRGHVGEFELRAREACALAGLGRLDEAQAMLSQYAASTDTPRWMYFGRLSELYEVAEMHEEALECHSQAYDDAPDNPTVQLDFAMALLKNERDPALARQLIDSAKEQHLSDVLSFFLPLIEGLWLLNTGNAPAAVGEFERARESFRPMAASPLVRLMIDINQAYLAIALADIGENERAAKEARPARIRLKAIKATRTLDRLERAIR